jgi:sugar lactone lactonase YvrE
VAVTSGSPASPSGQLLLLIDRAGKVQVLATKLNRPSGVGVDAFGAIDVTLRGSGNNTGSLERFVPGTKPSVAISGLADPQSVAVNPDGDIYFVESGKHRASGRSDPSPVVPSSPTTRTLNPSL